MACGTDSVASGLYTAMLAGENFVFPVVDLSSSEFDIPPASTLPIEALNNDTLTTRVVDGAGTFDAVAASMAAHLKAEYNANRITGAEYTKAYTALLEAALANSVQYLLQRNEVNLRAELLRVQLVQAKVEIYTAKVKLQSAIIEAKLGTANFALTKIKLVTEEANYCSSKYTLDNILPKQSTLLTSQIGDTNASIGIKLKQRDLTQEQVETQRAQTLDTRTDGVTVTGNLGKEKDLHAQQILNFRRDAEVKAARLFTEAWITSKTIDEALLPPSNFDNPSLDSILGVVKTNHGFV